MMVGVTIEIRSADAGDVDMCVRIVDELPEFFTDDVPAKVRAELREHDGWVAVEAGAVLGFCLVRRRFPATAEITWMAVARRNAGIGTRLVGHVLEALHRAGVELVEVKTLDQSAGYQPYTATRAFWERRG